MIGAGWERTILVCGKCSKRLGGGFGEKRRTALAKALRKFLGVKRGRKATIGIVETKCLGVCPRGAVTVIDGASPREWILVREGAGMQAVAEGLGLRPR
ncbi:MAG: (2Fe-2S) ferredoxin domain-containing protein [Sphingomonas sp.]|jgi:predicted metal-binding protein|uniref:(2Fe-2S) ferredoxin domain-containing protein n=1 Tax=Sphingomonas sp. TaxID=28214 RepID=UPI0035682E9A